MVAQELGHGERLEQLFAGAPSLTLVKLLLSVVENDLSLMLLGVKCAFLYGDTASSYLDKIRAREMGASWGDRRRS